MSPEALVGCENGARDVDRDGFDELLIGAYYNDDAASGAGAAYLVRGSASPSSVGLGAAVARFTGEASGDQAGWAVSGAGDVNGDGSEDIIVGAWQNQRRGGYAGAAYLLLAPGF